MTHASYGKQLRSALCRQWGLTALLAGCPLHTWLLCVRQRQRHVHQSAQRHEVSDSAYGRQHEVELLVESLRAR